MANTKKDEVKKHANNFARYSGIAFQMLATIGLFAFIGYRIDKSRNTESMIFTAILGLLGVVVSLVQVVRSLNKANK
ncbi:MAG: AtpZ/AtpI family protein [Bacteroidia bacterium]